MRSEVSHDDRRLGAGGTSTDGGAGEHRSPAPGAGASRPGARAGEHRSPRRGTGVPGRRTVTISGLGEEGYTSRNGTRPSQAARHRQLKRHERAGFRPDRIALWAVLLGVILMLVAAASSHAAAMAAHHLSALAGSHLR